MSVSYTFKERFRAKNLAEDNHHEYYSNCGYDIETVLATMQAQISVLCSQLLCNKDIDVVRSLKIKIEADGKKTVYSSEASNDILSADIQEAIRDITKAKKIKIELNYDYIWHAYKDYLAIGPFVMTGLLDECNDKIFDNVDYVMFNHADSGDGAGVISVYGKRKGAIHRGALEYSVTGEIPSFGNWYEPQTLTVIDNDDICVPEENVKRVTELCNDLMKMCNSREDDFSVEGNILYLVLNQPSLASAETINKFVSGISELATLITTPSDESSADTFYIAEFYDISEAAPNLLKIEVAYCGDATISSAIAF